MPWYGVQLHSAVPMLTQKATIMFKADLLLLPAVLIPFIYFVIFGHVWGSGGVLGFMLLALTGACWQEEGATIVCCFSIPVVIMVARATLYKNIANFEFY